MQHVYNAAQTINSRNNLQKLN